MAPPFHFILLTLLTLFISSFTESKLTYDYYTKSCPQFSHIVQDTVTNKQIISPTTAGGILRLFFHDCFVNGCDASLLISSTPFFSAERDADINLSLPGDAFDAVVRAKTALELACPGVVSCADILAVATRDLVVMVGGPFYPVPLGRKDALSSSAASVPGNLPLSDMSAEEIISLFARRGFSVEETVALSGAHTIGFSHCKEFASGIYNYSKSQKSDPTLNPRFAQGLQNACANFKNDPTLSVFNDIMTPNKFDNVYFQNLPKGLGILGSDRSLYSDPRTRQWVELYGRDQNGFFKAFAMAMQKLSLVGVKVGRHGEIRHRCDAFNNMRT